MNKYYKAAQIRKEDKGSFGNRGQKPGTGQKAKGTVGSQKGAKFAKEKLAKVNLDKKLKKVAAGMLKRIKPTSPEGPMHAQVNA